MDNSSGVTADRIGRGFYQIFLLRFIIILCEGVVGFKDTLKYYEKPKHVVPGN